MPIQKQGNNNLNRGKTKKRKIPPKSVCGFGKRRDAALLWSFSMSSGTRGRVSRTFYGKTWDQWIEEYGRNHQHPVNRACHSFGIPLIASSGVIALAGFFVHALWYPAAAMFVTGWTFQFVGHAFERKMPEFFRDWRFLFVGLRWWMNKVRGRV